MKISMAITTCVSTVGINEGFRGNQKKKNHDILMCKQIPLSSEFKYQDILVLWVYNSPDRTKGSEVHKLKCELKEKPAIMKKILQTTITSTHTPPQKKRCV